MFFFHCEKLFTCPICWSAFQLMNMVTFPNLLRTSIGVVLSKVYFSQEVMGRPPVKSFSIALSLSLSLFLHISLSLSLSLSLSFSFSLPFSLSHSIVLVSFVDCFSDRWNSHYEHLRWFGMTLTVSLSLSLEYKHIIKNNVF